jgi:hypothetical protein
MPPSSPPHELKPIMATAEIHTPTNFFIFASWQSNH